MDKLPGFFMKKYYGGIEFDEVLFWIQP